MFKKISLLVLAVSFLTASCAFNQITPDQKAQINNIMVVSVMGDTFSYTKLESDPADNPQQEPNISVETRQVQEWQTNVWIANYLKGQLDKKNYQSSVQVLNVYQGMSAYQIEGLAIQSARAKRFSHVLLVDNTGGGFFPTECQYTPKGYGVLSYNYVFLIDRVVVCATPALKFIDATTAQTIAAKNGFAMFAVQKNALDNFEPPASLVAINEHDWQKLSTAVKIYLTQRLDNALSELDL